MKIEKININEYGNIKDKEIKFDENINIIKGGNESGKSTLLSYIYNIFYGISKNKDGKEISDYERYKPWVGNDFSGKASYKLDNGEKFEVYRDFSKKNPKIYNDKLEDISSNFEIDKKEGNRFFYQQTGLDKQTYLSTVVVAQQEVRLDEQNQNILVQKIANLAGTGEANVSYQKAMSKLDAKIKDEIGNNRTSQKPINIIDENIKNINLKIEEIEPFKNKKYSIDSEKEELKIKIEKLSKKIEAINKIKKINNSQEIEKNSIDISINKQKENQEKIDCLNIEKNKCKEEKNNADLKIKEIENELKEKIARKEEIINKLINEDSKLEKHNSNIFYVIIEVLLIIILIIGSFIKNNLILIISGALFILFTIFIIIKSKKEKEEKNKKIGESKKELNTEKYNIEIAIEDITKNIQKEKEEENQKENKISMIDGQIDLLEKEIQTLAENIENLNKKLNIATEENVKEIINSSEGLINREELENINSLSEEVEKELSEEKIKLKGLEIDEKNILPKLDELVEYEEKKEELEQEYLELKEKEEIINIAINNLELAYEEMKTTITPKFTNNLSKAVSKITNGKYDKINTNDNSGMVIENKQGDYIELNRLSVGTIDELYLSLRLSMVDELAKENMPIILDETFAYFDEERLLNILKYLSEDLKEHQIIIFTCTNREKDAFEKIGQKYNLIEL